MTRKVRYTKPNSHTQQQAAAKQETVALICKQAGITRDEWVALLFETGCRWAENNSETKEQCKSNLENSDKGYWAWWICEFIADDQWLISNKAPVGGGEYEAYKIQITL
jgi:hypothetical protein